MKQITLLLFVWIAGIWTAAAQHGQHSMPMPSRKNKTRDALQPAADTMMLHQQMDHTMMRMEGMSHAFSPSLPMNRNGSGTGWLPDASPVYGGMIHGRKWMYMVHGNFFFRYNHQDVGDIGSRGGEKWDAPDWLMFMGQRKVGKKGLFRFSTMLSLDAVFAGRSGYPLLFQTGETNNGRPLVDRQHPHDLFSELSVAYTHSFSEHTDLSFYLGYPGEPALGSVAFMHRPSALPNPDAPLSHHWNDGTHITFGVATIGLRYRQFKIEGSTFTGREPDERRFGFDRPRFDSWSGRLSYAPSANWTLQASHGFVNSPEVLHPDEDVHRTTASAIYSKTFRSRQMLNATFLWGMNKVRGLDGEHAVLAEAAWQRYRTGFYLRYEWVQKSAEELALDEALYGHHTLYPVNALTLGINYDLLWLGQIRFNIGGHGTLYKADKRLDELYGNNPVGLEVYLRIYPGRL